MLQTQIRPLQDADVAAQRLGIRTWQLYQWCKEGIIPHVRLGRRLKFDMDALERFIADGGAALQEPEK